MNVKQDIRQWCGANVVPPPDDGVLRSFKIDRLRNGFVVCVDGCAAFGSVIDGRLIRFDGSNYWEHEIPHKRSKKIAFEWMVWEAARVMLERGERLSSEDGERLAVSVARLEAWL